MKPAPESVLKVAELHSVRVVDALISPGDSYLAYDDGMIIYLTCRASLLGIVYSTPIPQRYAHPAFDCYKVVKK